MEGIFLSFIIQDLFFDFSSNVPWQRIFGKIGEMTFIQHAGVPKWSRISNYDWQVLNGNILAALYAILMKIGRVTPKIMREETNFWDNTQKSAYLTEYLKK